MPKLSLIISVYNKLRELELVLTALSFQTFKDFEVILADDGSSPEFKELFSRVIKRNGIKSSYVHQEDEGFRKNKILNKAVLASDTDYLVFLDGDCLPHSDFMNQHFTRRAAGTVLCGSRVDLSRKFSEKISRERIENKAHEKNIINLILDSFKSKHVRSTRIEEGIYIGNELIHKLRGNRKPRLAGCNFSLPKELIMKINGFDENYNGPGIGEDTDIEFRLRKAGAKFNSVRNKAIVYHFYHKNTVENPYNLLYLEKVKTRDSYVCENGIKKL